MITNQRMKQVLVVDDSAFMRRYLTDMIEENPGFKVVGIARNGKHALELIPKLAPDIVTLDIEMPELNGFETLTEIQKLDSPPPVIMISSFTWEGSKETLFALENGAVDFVWKPSGSISLDINKVKQELLEKLTLAVKAKNHQKPLNTYKPMNIQHHNHPNVPTVVVIGSSTGGPKALKEVIPKFPSNFPGCIIIVQHMPGRFTCLMAERLNQLSNLQVTEAESGDRLSKGKVYVLPGGSQLMLGQAPGTSTNTLEAFKFYSDNTSPRSVHRPGVDATMDSVSQLKQFNLIGVVLTGMGSDGKQGVKSIYNSGGNIICEDESSCVIFGMPKAAIETGCVNSVVPLSNITTEILTYVKAD